MTPRWYANLVTLVFLSTVMTGMAHAHSHSHEHEHDHEHKREQPTLRYHEKTRVQMEPNGDVAFDAFGKHFDLQLASHRDTVSEDYQHTLYKKEGVVTLDRDNCHYVGAVRSDPHGTATVSNCVNLHGHRRLQGSVLAHGLHIYFEPSVDNTDEHIVYLHEDVENEGSCGSGGVDHSFDHGHHHHDHQSEHGRSLLQQEQQMFDQQVPQSLPYVTLQQQEQSVPVRGMNTMPGSQRGTQRGKPTTLEIYIINDQAASRTPGLSAEAIVTQADAIYRNGNFKQNIRLKLVGEESWVSGDKFVTAKYGDHAHSDELLRSLARWKKTAAQQLPPHDILMMITGTNLQGNTKGVANIGMVCGSRSVALIETSNNLKTDSAIFAHEVAHLIGAEHDGAGEQATCPGTGFIMSPNLSGLGLISGECNTAWVGDGYCDIRCMKYNADGGDCAQRTHDDAGNPLLPGIKPKEIGFSQCSERDIDEFVGRGPTCLLQEGNPHTMENSANMVGLTAFNKCNTAWVGDGYCDFRCVKYANDGGDCNGRTTDHSGNPLSMGGVPDYNSVPQIQRQPQVMPEIPQQKMPQMMPQQQQRLEECNIQWVGDGVCDHRCVKYQNDGGDCNGRTTDAAGYPLQAVQTLQKLPQLMMPQQQRTEECNIQWVGDGVCDHRCVKYQNDGGDCNGRTTDAAGYPLQGYNPWYNVMQQFFPSQPTAPSWTMGGRQLPGRG